jgi:hypothetical protein
MAFELVKRRGYAFQPALKLEELSLQATGAAGILVDTLDLIGVKEKYVALADLELLRIGVRAARADDGQNAYTVTVQRSKKGKDTGRRLLNLRAAIVQLGLDPRAVRGRYELQSVSDMLFVVLTSPTAQDRAVHAAREHCAPDKKAGQRK